MGLGDEQQLEALLSRGCFLTQVAPLVLIGLQWPLSFTTRCKMQGPRATFHWEGVRDIALADAEEQFFLSFVTPMAEFCWLKSVITSR